MTASTTRPRASSRGRAGSTPQQRTDEQPALIAAAPPDPPTTDGPVAGDAGHLYPDGLRVGGVAVTEAVMDPSNLSRGGKRIPSGRIVLTLTDGSTAFGCVDCLQTTATRGEMIIHRRDGHSQRRGPAKGGVFVPPSIQQMNVRELLELAGHVDGWAAAYQAKVDECDTWRHRALDAERHLRDEQVERERDKARHAAELDKASGQVRKFFAKQAQQFGMKVVDEQ